jgi:hypothetical protein
MQSIQTAWRGNRPHYIISACPILATEQYVKRHDTECAGLHFKYTRGNRGTIIEGTLV